MSEPLSTPAAQGTAAGVMPSSDKLARQIARAICVEYGLNPQEFEWRGSEHPIIPVIVRHVSPALASPSPEALPASGVEAARSALVGSRDAMSRAADIMEHAGKREDAERLRRQADECRGALAIMLSAALTAAPAPEARTDRNPAYDGPMGIFEGYGEEP